MLNSICNTCTYSRLVYFNANEIEFLDNGKLVYKILDNETLIVNGNEVDLTSSQQSLVTEYSTSIHAVVPEVKSIVIEGIELASDGVNMAFNELLGEGNNVGRDLTEELANLKHELEARFDSDEGFYIDHDGLDSGEFFGAEFEQRIESVVEEAVMNSMGSILIAVGQEMLFSGGDPEALEARMEAFGEQIEHEMEARGEQLEARADALCESAVRIDQLEEQLKLEIEELTDFNLISANTNRSDSI